MRQINHIAAYVLLAATLASCGGGGGGGGGSGANPPPGSGSAPSDPLPAAPRTAVTLANTGSFSGAFLQVVNLASTQAELLRSNVTGGYQPGTIAGNCQSGGTFRIELSSDRLALTETYSGCRVDNGAGPLTTDGTRRTVYSVVPGANAFVVTQTFAAFEVRTSNGVIETTAGTLRYEAGQRDTNGESQDRMILDLSIDSSVEGVLRLVNLTLDIDVTLDFLNFLVGVSGVSGEISHNGEGRLTAGFNDALGAVEFTGTDAALARLQILAGTYYTTFHADAGAPASAYGRLSLDDVRALSFFDTASRFAPIQRTSLVLDLRNVLVLDGDVIAFSLRDNFFDRDGDLMMLAVDIIRVVSQGRSGSETEWSLANAAQFYDLAEPEAGLLEFTSTLDDEIVTYSFAAHASDPGGLGTTDPLEFSIVVYRDTDGDGDPDRFDSDDDNDGVDDIFDAFPLDATEWDDTDQDGIGDNADTDDDNDSVADADDFYPRDPRCFAEQDGNGVECWFSRFSNRIDATIDRDGIVYLYDYGDIALGRHTVFRFDSRTGRFLTSFNLDPAGFGLDPNDANYSLEYVSAQHAMFVRYHDALVTRVDLAQPQLTETLFHTMASGSLFLNRVFDFAPWVAVFEQGSLGIHTWYSYDAAGSLIDTYTYDANVSAERMTAPESSSFCAEGHAVSRATGQYFEYSNPGQFNCLVFGEPVASPDGQEFLIYSGEVLDANLNTLRLLPFGGPVGSQRRWSWTSDGIWVPAGVGTDLYSSDGVLLDSLRAPVEPQPATSAETLVSGSAVAVLYAYPDGIRIVGWDGLQP